MFSVVLRRRAFHTFSRVLQEDVSSKIPPLASTIIKEPTDLADVEPKLEIKVDPEPYVKGKGKKLPPSKPNLVILDARNSNILARKPKPITQRQPGFFILDALELKNSRKKLEQFKSHVTEDQIIGSIQYIKPSDPVVSINRYQQIKNDISDAYSLHQLKAFFAKYHSDLKYKSKSKKKLIDTLLNDCWKLEKSSSLNAESDLLIERTFELDSAQMFLLLIQNTIQQWLRSNVQVILIPEEFQLVVRASEPHVQYIELALQNVFNNLKKEDLNIESVKLLADKFGVHVPIDEIQKLSGVFIQPEQSTEIVPIDEQDTISRYTMTALGDKRFNLAKRLIVGSLGQSHFSTTTLLSNWKDPTNKFYNFSLNDSLPWNHRSKEWVRSKEPKKPQVYQDIEPPTPPQLPYDEIYDGLYNTNNTAEQVTGEKRTVTAVTYGNILFDKSSINSDKPSTIFQTQLPHMRDVLVSLNPDTSENFGIEEDEEDVDTEEDLEIARAKSKGIRLESESLDVHDYYAQIKFVPSPFENHEDFLKHPPLEFWAELPYGKFSRETLQVFRVLSEKNSYVSLPTLNTDLKFLNSETESLVKPYDGTDTWLADQPGIQEFLKKCEIQIGEVQKVNIPEYVEINVPGSDVPVKYNYVSMSYRKHLSFEFKDRMIQFADVEGGALGGSTNEVLLVGDTEQMKPEEFKQFADDALEFAQKIKST